MNNQTERIQNAINHIKTATDIDPWAVEIAVEAMDMAIEALKSQDDSKESSLTHKALDTISRADAIDAIEKAKTAKAPDREMYVAKINAEMNIQLLPSVQPVQPEIVPCGDCKHWICHDRRCGYWNHGVKPLEWCCHAERKENR